MERGKRPIRGGDGQGRVSATGDADSETARELKLTCMANLLATTEERVYFKDLESRFLFVSAGWIAASATAALARLPGAGGLRARAAARRCRGRPRAATVRRGPAGPAPATGAGRDTGCWGSHCPAGSGRRHRPA